MTHRPDNKPRLSVVATTDDEAFVDELKRVLGDETELIVVSTVPMRAGRATTLQVLGLDSSYRRNRGLAAATGDVVAFLEDGQLPGPNWREAVLRAFAGGAAAAVAGRLPLHAGGNVAYDRPRLFAEHGFPLFTGAPPGSPVPDLLVLLRLRDVATAPGMALAQTPPPVRDPRRVGRALRARQRPALAVRRAALDLRRGSVSDVIALVRGVLEQETRYEPPPEVVQPPREIGELLGERSLVPAAAQRKGKLHFLFRAGDLMVHLYASPDDHLREAVAAHRTIGEVAPAGVPRVRACAEGVDSLWLAEEMMVGAPIGGKLLPLREHVAAWVVALGGPPGPPLASSAAWQSHREAVLGAGFPPDVQQRLRHSLEAVDELRARYLHGDLNPRNVLSDGERFAAVDWENAALEFLPGLDLVFLFLLARGTPDEHVVLRPAPLVPYLRELGVSNALRPHALRVMLATWTLGERNRRARLGVDPGPAVFEPLFLRCERLLA